MSVLKTYYRLPDALIPREEPGPEAAPEVVERIKAVFANARPPTDALDLSAVLTPSRSGSSGKAFALSCPLDALVDELRFERYYSRSQPPQTLFRKTIRSAYYLLRPLLPVAIRKHLQRSWLKDWQTLTFPRWPVDTTVEAVLEAAVGEIIERAGRLPFIWFWPDGHQACAILTHDVETAKGRDFCGSLIETEQRFGVVSSFEIVPEQRYEVTDDFLSSIRSRGCEICVHDLNHDGRLFTSKELFLERASRINDYAKRFGAVGFRSAVMYRNVDWLQHLSFEYDMSIPNVAHLDPQRGGCCTIMPFEVGNLLELPLTTTQDYPLFYNLNRYDIDLWKEQIEIIIRKYGLISFIVHPDYITESRGLHVYEELLDYIGQLRGSRQVWHALPRDVSRWWRQRGAMKLVERDGSWHIEGDGAARASLAWLELDGGRVVVSRPQRSRTVPASE